MDTYELGPFRLDASTTLLLHGDEPVALGQRAIALLRALIRKPGALVPKDVLIEAAWPGQAIEDSNLPVQIAALRRILGVAPGGECWIETLPRRGYRFVGPVVVREENSVAGAPQIDHLSDAVPVWHGEAERRQITALSCGLFGVGAGADGTGLEELRETVRDFRRCVSETAARHTGVIYRQFGDHLLVLFGYPEAHEHDAEQAIRTGLELCVAMRCRVGIATGMVIIGEPVEGEALEGREIVGDVPNLAARLLASAQADTVVTDGVTRRLIGNLFACRDLGALETNSDTEPTRRWQVMRESHIASRFEALRGSKSTRLIGRDEEIDQLLRRWARVKAGAGQIILVSGEAGIGKSRIAAAFEERLQSAPHLRLSYFCSPYHQDSALFPVIDQLGRAAGFARDDPPDAKWRKLAALLVRTKSPDEDVAFLANLMSLPTSERYPLPNLTAQRKKERTLEALIRQLDGLAHEKPVIAVFEDAHWLDPTSRELLDLAIEYVRSLPVLLIVTFRPEFQPPWTGEAQVSTLVLNCLDRRDRVALIAQIAGGKTLPHEVVTQIADRTDGVPLFVEELTKTVLESGLLREKNGRCVLDRPLPPLAIPVTLHASLLARLDRLGPVRHVAQTCAAIGRQFSYALLRLVCRLPEDELQTALDRLVASELVLRRGMPSDAVYSFKHALVQDAAHSSLLRSTRQQLHARIAEVLETDFPDIVVSQPELLAQHYGEAGLAEQSATYWEKAGRRSIGGAAMAEAAVQLRKGLEQLAFLPDTPERQRQELEFLSALGPVLQITKGFAAQETAQTYTRARDLWEQLGLPSEFLHIPYGQARNHVYRCEFGLAMRVSEDLLRLSRQRNDTAGLVLGHDSSARDFLFAGKFASSRSHVEEMLALYDPVSHHSLVDQTGFHLQVGSAWLGIILFCLGYPDQASVQSDAAIAKARRLAHAVSLAACLSSDAWRHSIAGDDATLNERAQELVAVTTERGFAHWGALGALYRGWARIKRGKTVEALLLIRGGLANYRATGTELWMPYFTDLLARACEIAGQIGEAATLVDEALQIVERTGERWFTAELYRHKGQLQLRQGHAGAAEEMYRNALSVAQQQEAKQWELRAATCLARLRHEQDHRTEARDILEPVYAWFTEGFDTFDLKEARTLLDEVT
jgi:DNA-binding winged helix-turn-helix (wHTH) protein/predicted ATPase